MCSCEQTHSGAACMTAVVTNESYAQIDVQVHNDHGLHVHKTLTTPPTLSLATLVNTVFSAT